MTGRERNFTQELFGDMGATLGENWIDGNTDSWWDGVQDFFRVNRPAIGDEVRNINKYLTSVCEKNDITTEKLNNIFEAVRAVEDAHSGKTAGVVTMLTDYRDLLKLFRDAMRDFVHNDTKVLNMTQLKEDIAPLRTSLQDKRMKLDEQLAQELQEALGKYMNPDGTYNWDEIEKAMKSDANTIKSSEIMALTLTYLNMKAPEDINHFIYCGYVIDVLGGSGRMLDPGRTYSCVTDVFRLVNETTKVTVGTTLVLAEQISGMTKEPMPEMADWIIRMQILDYAVTVRPKGVATHFTSPSSYGYGCYYTEIKVLEENGKLVLYDGFYDSKSLPVELKPEMYNVSSVNLQDYAIQGFESLRPNGYTIVDAIGTSVISVGVSLLLAAAFPEAILGAALALVLSTAAGATYDTLEDWISTSVENAAENDKIDILIQGMKDLTGFDLLGYEIITTTSLESQLIVHYINRNTAQNTINTYGFLNSEAGRATKLTKAQFEAIIRSAPSLGEKNYELYKAFDDYVNDPYNYKTYANELEETLKNSSTVDKTDIKDCTPGELRRLAAENNERLADEK